MSIYIVFIYTNIVFINTNIYLYILISHIIDFLSLSASDVDRSIFYFFMISLIWGILIIRGNKSVETAIPSRF